MLRVTSANTLHAAQIGTVHADDVVEFIIIRTRHLARRMAVAANAVFQKLALCGRIHRVAEFLSAHRRRSNLKCAAFPRFRRKVFHHKLRHRAAADIAVANK